MLRIHGTAEEHFSQKQTYGCGFKIVCTIKSSIRQHRWLLYVS
jgi:hypothetical protein